MTKKTKKTPTSKVDYEAIAKEGRSRTGELSSGHLPGRRRWTELPTALSWHLS
jgi:hypothetical protein